MQLLKTKGCSVWDPDGNELIPITWLAPISRLPHNEIDPAVKDVIAAEHVDFNAPEEVRLQKSVRNKSLGRWRIVCPIWR